ncbi:MAG: Endonuclease/exonuclease/phosphatase [Acidobacteria bacterium]|jgi:endonuclease/exonuclease/phosphatase family metal-dependent hydrolase|nr:Endonuclease/exonuclease/phosphatase [Acidobacteriota bacterium]
MKSSFRIATYNIHKCKGLDLQTSPLRIADVLREIDADIVALQEVVSVQNGAAKDDQARFIAGELGFDYRIGENRRHLGGLYGNVILSRFPIKETRNHDITVPGREPRGCLHADIQVNSNDYLHIYNIHLGTAFFERRKQAIRLLDAEILNRDHYAPRIMLGDFNEWTRGLASRLLKSHFRSADLREHLPRKRTYPGIFPFLHLDHIYYDNHLKIENAFVHRTRLALVASDHLPLVADFCLK